MAELTFDIDQRLVRGDPERIAGNRHLFVSGLARSGTTALLRRFHATEAFRSLTYRDMPFVLAPNLWRILSRSQTRGLSQSERAHGDGIFVDADSPESFEEVFWRIFDGSSYITKTHLKPHQPSDAILRKYRCYVSAVLAAHDPPLTRYLCKNNNNVLRLASLRRAFPNALILIPFRDPVDHANSLLRQHRHFSRLQDEDGFVLQYMTWLGHHEFGRDHRPFRFDENGPLVASPDVMDTLDPWLANWLETYGWLETTAPKDAVFVCYEDFCVRPEVWSRLADLAGVPETLEDGAGFVRRNAQVEAPADSALLERANRLYARLAERSRTSLEYS